MSWAEVFGILFGAGGFVVTALTIVLNRRKSRAEADKAEAEALKADIDATVAVDAYMRSLRTENLSLHDTLEAMRNEVSKKIAEAVAQVEAKADEKVAELQKQLDEANRKNRELEAVITKQTVDQAKVEIAERYIAERDEIIAERDDLKKRVTALEGEVAELKEQQSRDEAALRAAANNTEGRLND